MFTTKSYKVGQIEMHEAVDFIVFDFMFSKLLGGAYVIKNTHRKLRSVSVSDEK